jgi:hypothetical protein
MVSIWARNRRYAASLDFTGRGFSIGGKVSDLMTNAAALCTVANKP